MVYLQQFKAKASDSSATYALFCFFEADEELSESVQPWVGSLHDPSPSSARNAASVAYASKTARCAARIDSRPPEARSSSSLSCRRE